MAKRIRVIYRVPKKTFTERLEARAKQISDRHEQQPPREHSPMVSSLEQQISLTLDHIAGLRGVHAQLRRRLVRIECYVDTEIMQRTPRPLAYEDHYLAQRDMLRARLMKIEDERRRLALSENEALRQLHDRLLDLMEKHRHLDYHNGHRNNRPKT